MYKTGVKLLIFLVEVISVNDNYGTNLVKWYKFTFAVWRKRES